jgi:hypothetical protein
MVAIANINDTSVITANTPQCLRTRRQWVCWRLEKRPDGKTTKVPYAAATGGKASTTDPGTWTTFEQAIEVYGRRECYSGVGYVFSKDDPYCGIDLDDCRRDDGSLAPWAQEIVDQLPSYCEISPSDTGVKIFLMGKRDALQSRLDKAKPAAGPSKESDLRAWAVERTGELGRLLDGRATIIEARRLVHACVDRIEIEPTARRGVIYMPSDAYGCFTRDTSTRGNLGDPRGGTKSKGEA